MKTNKTLNELKSDKNSNVTSFIKEVQDICRKYQISISHEDSHGSFILTDYNDLYNDYLNDAINETTTNKKKQLTLTNELQVGDQTIQMNYKFDVDVSEELFEDINNLVFKQNPDNLYKCKFEDIAE